ncbi:MAG TPA: ATP-binding cassette domain-containing protein [Phycisphaerae bacterium]|nr:ATP-binding cassette domain-containing protein [Phycisphaerae bacterium]
MVSVSLQDVSKSFGEVHAVDHLSARVPAGCIYGFLGPNGAGKTTTLRMIMDIIRPDAGRIEVLGQSSTSLPKARIGYMPEERGLYRKMRVAKALAYFGAIKGVSSGELTERVPRWLSRMGLTEWASRKVEELSRGMHQKLQFAVTVINDPDLLILDEPFSGLDPVNLDLLKEIVVQVRGEGKTVIFSTHVMHEAENLCDFILLIDKGRTVVDGTLDEIRARYHTRAAMVEFEGDPELVESLPAVRALTRQGRSWQIDLADGTDHQDLLRQLVGRVSVQGFEVKVPTLHEIFVHLVKGSDGQDR